MLLEGRLRCINSRLRSSSELIIASARQQHASITDYSQFSKITSYFVNCELLFIITLTFPFRFNGRNDNVMLEACDNSVLHLCHMASRLRKRRYWFLCVHDVFVFCFNCGLTSR